MSLQAYQQKKFALLANFFHWQFYSCKVLRPEGGTPGLTEFYPKTN